MRRIMRLAVLVLVVCLLAVPALAGQQQTLLFGLIPEMNIFKQKQRFKVLGKYLSKKTDIAIEFTILSRYGNIIDSFTTEKMDGAFFGSFTGALAIERLGVVPLVRPVNIDNTSSYRGYLFVRKGSGIKDIKDMKGKRMAFVDKATTAGYLFPLAYLREHGVQSLDGFFSRYLFTGSHDAAMYAVMEGKADIGAAKHSVYDRIRSEDPKVDKLLTIIAMSPWVPSNGLCVRKDLDPDIRKKLKSVLLAMHKDPEGMEVLKQFGALQFIETTAGDYHPVLDMAHKAGIDIKTYNYRNE